MDAMIANAVERDARLPPWRLSVCFSGAWILENAQSEVLARGDAPLVQDARSRPTKQLAAVVAGLDALVAAVGVDALQAVDGAFAAVIRTDSRRLEKVLLRRAAPTSEQAAYFEAVVAHRRAMRIAVLFED